MLFEFHHLVVQHLDNLFKTNKSPVDLTKLLTTFKLEVPICLDREHVLVLQTFLAFTAKSRIIPNTIQ